MNRTPLAALAFLALASPLLARPALAAESYDNCAGTVPVLPAVLDKQGVWCLTKDLATLLASGNAITVTKPNVTLDCNGFKLGGLGAGASTATIGIEASGQSNFTVRGCNIRGFAVGVNIDDSSGGGHLVEDNRFDGNTLFAINVFGDGSMIRRNQVMDTGGGTGAPVNRIGGIYAEGNVDILDNTVRVVDGSTQTSASSYGILLLGAQGGTIAGNRVGGITSDPNFLNFAIRSFSSSGVAIRDNDVSGFDGDFGLACSTASSAAVGNTIHGFNSAIYLCRDGGNTTYP